MFKNTRKYLVSLCLDSVHDKEKKLYYAYSTKKTDKYTSLNQVRKNKYCSRLIALRQAEAPLGEERELRIPNPVIFFYLKILYPITNWIDDFPPTG